MANSRVWLLEIAALDASNNPTTLYFSSGEYISPLGIYYDLRIKQPALFTSSAFIGSILQTNSRSGYGETTLVNSDGGLDYLADYAVDGRVALLKLKSEDDIINTVISGTVQSIAFDGNMVSIRLRDPQEVLTLNHPGSIYAGTNMDANGVEGTANDIKGNNKPKVYGKVSNALPVQVNTAGRIYQVHDSSINPSVSVEIQSVYDRGIAYVKHQSYTSLSALQSASVPSGRFADFQGYFKLGSAPTGTITCDVNSSIHLAGSVFGLLATEAGYGTNPTDITNINSVGSVGIYLTDNESTSSLLDNIASSCGAYWYFDTNNTIRVKQLDAPSVPLITVEEYEILEISRSSTGAGANGVPIYKVSVKADKIETVQTDLATAVPEDVRARLQQQYREGVAISEMTKTRHLLSEELVIESCLRTLISATTQASRLLGVLSVRRDNTSCTLRIDSDSIGTFEVGNTISIKTNKLGYNIGKSFVILGYTLDARLNKVTLELFG